MQVVAVYKNGELEVTVKYEVVDTNTDEVVATYDSRDVAIDDATERNEQACKGRYAVREAS